MSGSSIWDALGIDPASEEVAIRKAYAAKLKQTNPEDDAEGFKRLRAAYELALRHAAWRAQSPVGLSDTDDEADLLDSDLMSEPFAPVQLVPRPQMHSAAPAAFQEELENHMAARQALERELAINAAPEQLQAALTALLTSPAMQQIDVFQRTQEWLVYLLHRTRPNSLPLIDPVIRHFGWTRQPPRVNEWGGPASLFALRETIGNEAAAKQYVDRVREPTHEFNRAYRLLAKSESPTGDRGATLLSLQHVGVVDRFLVYTRTKFPAALAYLDPALVERWRKRISWALPKWHLVRALVGLALIFGTVIALGMMTPTVRQRALDNPHDAYAARQSCAASALGASYLHPDVSAYAMLHADCEHALRLMPDSLTIRIYSASIDLAAGEPGVAREALRPVLARAPSDAVASYANLIALSWERTPPPVRDQSLALLIDALKGYGEARHTVEVTAGRIEQTEPDVVTVPAYDILARADPTISDATMQAAYDHFGLAPFDASARLRCKVSAFGVLADCTVVSEDPADSGAAEMALHLASSLAAQPAQMNGAPVDGAPVEIPFRFVATP